MKNNRTLTIIIIALVAIIGVTAYLNRDESTQKTALNNDAVFEVTQNEQVMATYTMSDIQAMGQVTFTATLKSSGNDPVDHEYAGVPLITILENAGIKDLSNKSSIVVSAIDGYMVSVDIDKVLDAENVYLAYVKDGELIGTREAGGDGPYQVIISKDQFSQYWCKYAYSVEVKE